MIINVHAHIRTEDDPKQRVNYYRAPGMEKVCLSGEASLVMEAFKYAEDFVVPVVSVDPSETSPADLAAFHADGFKGVRLDHPSAPYDDERFFGLYGKLEELSLPVFFQTGHIRGREKCRIEYTRPICLDTIARYFPGLYIVGSQLGSPWFFEALTAMLYNERVYFDMSGGVLRALPLSWFKFMFMFRDVYLLPGGIRHRLHDERINHDLFRNLLFGTGLAQPEVVDAFYRDLFQNLQIDFETQALVFWKTAEAMLEAVEAAS